MDIEKERGITIKAQTVRLDYKAKDGVDYVLNLMDTPGHVDFAYEVSRSLAACEGALLIVDASPGRRSADAGERLSGARSSISRSCRCINKIDLPAAEPERVKQQIEDVIGLDASKPSSPPARRARGSTNCSKPSSRACRRRNPATPTRR